MRITLDGNRLQIQITVQEMLEMQTKQNEAALQGMKHQYGVSMGQPAALIIDGKTVPVAIGFTVFKDAQTACELTRND